MFLVELALLLEDLPALERARIQLVSNEDFDCPPPNPRSQLLKIRYPLSSPRSSSSSSSTSFSLRLVLDQELSFESSYSRVPKVLFARIGEEEHDLLDHSSRVGRDRDGPLAVSGFGSIAEAL